MNIKHMIQFLDDDDLEQLADKIAASPDGVYEGVTAKELLPFLDEDKIDELMLASYRQHKDTRSFYPFASDDGLANLLAEALNHNDSSFDLRPLLPFLEDEDIAALSTKIFANQGSFGGLVLSDILPFMDDDDVDAAFVDALKNHSPQAHSLAPYVSEDGYAEVVDLIEEGKLDNSVLDDFYPFMDDDSIKRLFRLSLH